jgi:hypothetical protein
MKKKTQEKAQDAPKVAEVYYTRETWRGIKEVYKCARCGIFRDGVDEMIEHVILHYPLNQQQDLFDKLIKEI